MKVCLEKGCEQPRYSTPSKTYPRCRQHQSIYNNAKNRESRLKTLGTPCCVEGCENPRYKSWSRCYDHYDWEANRARNNLNRYEQRMTYGKSGEITQELLDKLLVFQEGRCLLTGELLTPDNRHLDHHHLNEDGSGPVRGWLTAKANTYVGHVETLLQYGDKPSRYVTNETPWPKDWLVSKNIPLKRGEDYYGRERKWRQYDINIGGKPALFCDYLEVLVHQNYRCAICDKSIDVTTGIFEHCHKEKEARGICCQGCNIRLAGFEDPRLVAEILYYIDNNASYTDGELEDGKEDE